jgi:hypothetical protein
VDAPHVKRWTSGGDPASLSAMARGPVKTLAERRPDVWRRFRAFVAPAADGCELWTGPTKAGVPYFHHQGARAARQFALLFAGRHRTTRVLRLTTSCGNDTCVALDHVVVVPRKRTLPNRHKVLDAATKAELLRLRQTDASIAEIARRCNCHPSSVLRIAGPRRPQAREAVA